MNINKQNNLNRHTKVLEEQAKDPPLTILLIDSTNPPRIITSSFCAKDVPEGNSIEIVKYNRTLRNIPCQIIDSSNLSHAESSVDYACLEEIKAKIDSIWFASCLDETDVNIHEKSVIKWITAMLGEEAWNYVLLLFTQTNTAKNTWKRATMLKKRSENLRSEIAQYTGWDIASGITSVPVTSLKEMISDEQNWAGAIYIQILRRMKPGETARYFLRAEINAMPSTRKVIRESSSQWQGIHKKTKRRDFQYRISTLAYCYIWSAPAGAIGMCLWGSEGFGIVLVGNVLLWIVLRWLRYVQG